jgi:PPOX class probable F420-dependent enzyme
MPIDIDQRTIEFIRSHRVARLATAGNDRQPGVVPICYVFDGERVYTPVDEKPKSVPAGKLRRVQNIQVNPRVALVVDDYFEDWSQLVYVLITGTAEVLSPDADAAEHSRALALLREKYQQYRAMKLEERPIIRITPTRIRRWAAVNKGNQA